MTRADAMRTREETRHRARKDARERRVRDICPRSSRSSRLRRRERRGRRPRCVTGAGVEPDAGDENVRLEDGSTKMRVPSEHPLYEDAYAKACLNAVGTRRLPTEIRVGTTTNNEPYWSSALGACATTPTVSAGQLLHNREHGFDGVARGVEHGLEKDKTVRIA